MIKLRKLIEGFDPCSSAGPNPAATEGTQDNPYPDWNAKMRQMEENNLPPSGEEKYNKQEPGGTMSAVNLEEDNKPKTFREIRTELDPDGTKHDLTLKCIKCGTTERCKYTKPKRKIEGICYNCAIKESEPHGREAQEAGAMDLCFIE